MPKWAIYLGISWTWCIGMFLPVLLVRDFGLWAFVAFALPNVIGAAAMGWVLKDEAASREMVARHTGAMVSFSKVTIAFQAFFAGWMLPQLIGWWTALLYPVLVVSLIFAVRKDREFAWLTTGTLAVSAALWATAEAWGLTTLPAAKGIDGAALLAPVCLAGFLLCPYLDLTFHHAFQKASTGGRWAARLAFTLGFGVVFAAMIVFSLRYADRLLTDPTLKMLVGGHMLVQLSATILLHQVRSAAAARKPNSNFLALVGGFFLLGLALLFVPDVFGWQAGEYVYRGFLAYYGLLAPAYVLLRIVPVVPAPMRLLGGVVITALPFYAIGFYTRYTSLLLVGVGILLVGWVLSGIMARQTPAPVESRA